MRTLRFAGAKPRRGSLLYKFLLGAVSMMAVVVLPSAGLAETYKWLGNRESDPSDLGLYEDSQRNHPTSFDGIDVSLGNKQEIAFTDETMSALTAMHSLRHGSNSRIIIDVTNDYTFAFLTFSPSSSAAAAGTNVKRGPGTVEFTNDEEFDASGRRTDFWQNFVVEEGRVVFPQDVATAIAGTSSKWTFFLRSLVISNGAEVVSFGSRSATAGELVRVHAASLFGGGDLLYTNDVNECRFEITDEGSSFSGRILAPKLELRPDDIDLTGVENVMKSCYSYGRLGGLVFGNEDGQPSSFGNGTASMSLNADHAEVCYLGGPEAGQCSFSRRWQDFGNFTTTLDAGAYGNLLADFRLFAEFGLRMKEFILTGSNAVESVFKGGVGVFSDSADRIPKNGFYYLTKRGTGTWRMSGDRPNSRYKIAGVGVEEGTLKVDTLAERGMACSIGLATNLLGYAYKGTIAEMPEEAPYAIRLGTATDLTKEGTFEYSGSQTASISTRLIAVTGKGRLKNDTEQRFKWTGVMAAVPPEGGVVPAANTLTLDGSSVRNELCEISERAGAGPLSVVKDGTGTWTLANDVDFTGGVAVNAGTLAIENYSYFTWFRFTITENKAGSPNPTPGKTSGNNYSISGELGLFDADGMRQNAGLGKWSANETGTSVGQMEPGYASYGKSASDRTDQPLVNLFDGDGHSTWFYSDKVVTTTNEATHCPIVMRLPRTAKPIAAFDLTHPYGLTGAYENSKATQFTLEGSADGRTWCMITNVTDLVYKKQDVWNYSQTTVGSPEAPVPGVLALPSTTIPADVRRPVLTNGISKLSVAAGASFVVYGDPVTVKGLEIAAAGVGTVTGVSFPASGSVNVTGVDVSQPKIHIPFDFSALDGSENLGDWTVTVNGSACDTRRYVGSMTPTGLTLVKRGLVLIVR